MIILIILGVLIFVGLAFALSMVVALFIVGLRWFNENITKFKVLKMLLYVITFLPLFPFYAFYLSAKTMKRAKEVEEKLKDDEISLTEFFSFYNKNKWILGKNQRQEMLMTAQLLNK